MQCRRPAAVFKYMSCRAKDFFSILRVHYTDSTDSTDSSPSQSPLCLPAITDLADCDSNDKKKSPSGAATVTKTEVVHILKSREEFQ